MDEGRRTADGYRTAYEQFIDHNWARDGGRDNGCNNLIVRTRVGIKLRDKSVRTKAKKIGTRQIAISRVLRAFSDRQTDRQTDRPTDRPTEWLIESRARD